MSGWVFSSRDRRSRMPASGHLEKAPSHPHCLPPSEQTMPPRLALPRPAARRILNTTTWTSGRLSWIQRSSCIRYHSTSTHEPPTKPSIAPPTPSLSHPREPKRPETLHSPPVPPRNNTPSASSITSTRAPDPTSGRPPSSPSTATKPLTSSPAVYPATTNSTKKEPRFNFKPVKAALTLTPKALAHIKEILDQPEPKLVRVGVKNRGCAGLAYHLEYVDKPGKFDEIVEQDGSCPSSISH